jgi:predicted amidophosphoribosyltransferase
LFAVEFQAATHGFTDVCKYLVSIPHGKRALSTRTFTQSTALLEAAQGGHSMCALFLIRAGSNIYATDRFASTHTRNCRCIYLEGGMN